MTNATLRGKPDAGNPHVAPPLRFGVTSRFDEGEVAPTKPRRGAPFYKHLCLVLAVAATGVAAAETYTLTSVSGSTDSLTSGTYWSGGIAPSDVTAAGHDFTVTLSGLRTPYTTTFNCNSLTFGDATHVVNLYMKEGSWTFPETSAGVTFARVQFSDWTDGTKTYAINGPVTFSDVFSKTAAGRYACSFFSDKNTANAVVHDFTGKVSASADARLENYLKNPTGGRHYGLRFSGDLTAFEGEMVMGNSARLEIGATTTPGTITASGTDVILAPVSGTAGFSVGTLALAEGTTLEITLNRNTGAAQPVTVTKKLTAGALTVKILAETYASGTTVPERKYAILRFPSEGSTFDPEAVTLVSDTADTAALVPSVETVEGVTTFYLTHAATLPIITRVVGGEYLENGATWSDGEIPHANAEYLSSGSVSGNFRLWATNSPYVFPGNKLTLQGGNAIAQCNDITISNLVVTADANMLNWHPGSKVSESLSSNGIRYHRGDILLSGGALSFSSQVPIHFVFDGNISGEKRLNIAQNQSTGTFASPLYAELRGTNTFTELMNVWSKNATSFETGVVICFREGRNLGGNPASFIYNANNMTGYVTYRALASTTLETMNRGICFENFALETPENVTLTVKQRIRYKGNLTKRGAGTLVLANARDIAVSSPVLTVEDGFLKVAESNAVSDVALNFTGDAALKVDVEADSEAGFGLRNTTLDTPFTLATDDGKLHVKIDADPMPTRGRAPICTVSTAAADALRGKIVVAKPARGFKGVVTERVLEEGTVTFAAEIQPTGLMITIR